MDICKNLVCVSLNLGIKLKSQTRKNKLQAHISWGDTMTPHHYQVMSVRCQLPLSAGWLFNQKSAQFLTVLQVFYCSASLSNLLKSHLVSSFEKWGSFSGKFGGRLNLYIENCWGMWVAYLVKCPALSFNPGHDLVVMGWAPHRALCSTQTLLQVFSQISNIQRRRRRRLLKKHFIKITYFYQYKQFKIYQSFPEQSISVLF